MVHSAAAGAAIHSCTTRCMPASPPLLTCCRVQLARLGSGSEVMVPSGCTPAVPSTGLGPDHHQSGRSPAGPLTSSVSPLRHCKRTRADGKWQRSRERMQSRHPTAAMRAGEGGEAPCTPGLHSMHCTRMYAPRDMQADMAAAAKACAGAAGGILTVAPARRHRAPLSEPPALPPTPIAPAHLRFSRHASALSLSKVLWLLGWCTGCLATGAAAASSSARLRFRSWELLPFCSEETTGLMAGACVGSAAVPLTRSRLPNRAGCPAIGQADAMHDGGTAGCRLQGGSRHQHGETPHELGRLDWSPEPHRLLAQAVSIAAGDSRPCPATGRATPSASYGAGAAADGAAATSDLLPTCRSAAAVWQPRQVSLRAGAATVGHLGHVQPPRRAQRAHRGPKNACHDPAPRCRLLGGWRRQRRRQQRGDALVLATKPDVGYKVRCVEPMLRPRAGQVCAQFAAEFGVQVAPDN